MIREARRSPRFLLLAGNDVEKLDMVRKTNYRDSVEILIQILKKL